MAAASAFWVAEGATVVGTEAPWDLRTLAARLMSFNAAAGW